MKASKVKTLDDRDREFAETLQKLGVEQNVAAMITYLMNVDKATSREIEIGTDLRQPEVSICAKTLRLVNGDVKLSNYGGIKLTTYLKSFPQA
jgi:predicted transcriptional regulator